MPGGLIDLHIVFAFVTGLVIFHCSVLKITNQIYKESKDKATIKNRLNTEKRSRNQSRKTKYTGTLYTIAIHTSAHTAVPYY